MTFSNVFCNNPNVIPAKAGIQRRRICGACESYGVLIRFCGNGGYS